MSGAFNPKRCDIPYVEPIPPIPEIQDCELPEPPEPIVDCPDPVMPLPGPAGPAGSPGADGAPGPAGPGGTYPPAITVTASAECVAGPNYSVAVTTDCVELEEPVEQRCLLEGASSSESYGEAHEVTHGWNMHFTFQIPSCDCVEWIWVDCSEGSVSGSGTGEWVKLDGTPETAADPPKPTWDGRMCGEVQKTCHCPCGSTSSSSGGACVVVHFDDYSEVAVGQNAIYGVATTTQEGWRFTPSENPLYSGPPAFVVINDPIDIVNPVPHGDYPYILLEYGDAVTIDLPSGATFGLLSFRLCSFRDDGMSGTASTVTVKGNTAGGPVTHDIDFTALGHVTETGPFHLITLPGTFASGLTSVEIYGSSPTETPRFGIDDVELCPD